ncbi:MAG: protein-glutamate O-methyltransferase CheR [Deltaproteobacteria bacterium]|nr:protein-glutamate O-methyltransferase CheR [Deltaproteobacteria bacterium]
MVKITQEEHDLFCQYIQALSGIHLDGSKAYLLETRLASLLEQERCTCFAELYHKAKHLGGETLRQKIIDRISTNETLFFRDKRPFELLQHKIIPDLIDARKAASSGFFPTPIRIWSAACSTGQEIYSVAIVLRELLQDLNGYRIQLLGTDLSNTAIARASRGEYNQFEIKRGLSEDTLKKHFTFNGNAWKINDDIRAMVSFKKTNLMLPFDGLGKFDIVFCRNVGVYFNMTDRKKLFSNISRAMEKDGYLIIGATESLINVDPQYEPRRYLRSVFYQLK